ncbi:hypothetical protein NIES4072_70110 [Nostoc commune NIES-4072]|uniref:Uncharacterized protein n=1 Tax=Nostoc commune NIES-4072 TaxID=2005467 RepID=A0A2R5FZ21_NOSCO|nr:hypothetical protein [Nostoc commune]BBD70644.1 hypothetical protein NIES4070_70550 [Nostoc commune HK-02]GBG23299.1 hypothetical protein NIES4072_70110 [Nostoc commune NIES-4072]
MKVEIVRQENNNLGVPEQRQEVGNSESDINEAIDARQTTKPR